MTSEQDILSVALVGAQYGGAAVPATASPVDQLPLAPGADRERDLLLRAGAWAIYRRAGYLPATAPNPPQPAPTETRRVCSPGARALLEILLTAHADELLPEALDRLNAAHLRLPPTLLPLAIANTPARLRPALAPALGARGRWLGRFNPAWSWAAETLDDAVIEAASAQQVWEEGATSQRVAVLQWLRRSDPARARDLLAEVWKREKAETRAALLATLAVNLAAEDEPLLTQALTDRGESARKLAANLLTQLPASALAQRMRQRAAATLSYVNGKLDATPPTAADAEWGRDGLEIENKRAGMSAPLLTEPLRRVPPEHWEALYAATPDTLVAATADSVWRSSILRAWTAAAERFGAARWALPLWRFWLSAPREAPGDAGGHLADLCASLAPLLPAAEPERLALSLLADPSARDDIARDAALDLLPLPWSAAVASAYLSGLRAFIASLTPDSTSTEPWALTLRRAAVGLPASHFAAALEPFTLPENMRWQVASIERALDAFATRIHLRARIAKEIPL